MVQKANYLSLGGELDGLRASVPFEAMYGELQRQTLLVSLKEVYGYAVLAGIVFLLGVMAMRYRRIVRYVRVPPVEVFKRLLEIRMLTKAKS